MLMPVNQQLFGKVTRLRAVLCCYDGLSPHALLAAQPAPPCQGHPGDVCREAPPLVGAVLPRRRTHPGAGRQGPGRHTAQGGWAGSESVVSCFLGVLVTRPQGVCVELGQRALATHIMPLFPPPC